MELFSGLSLHQLMCMTTTFLMEHLRMKCIAMQQPKGFECPGKEEFVAMQAEQKYLAS